MRELTKIFGGVEIPVQIINEKNMYFTVSSIARENNKNITEWKNSKRVKELLIVLDKSNDINSNLIKVDSLGRTQIHNSLFVNFARFISVEFEIASNQIIMDILLGNNITSNEQLFYRDEKISQLTLSNKKLQEKVYAKPRGFGFETVFRIISDCEADISASDFNKLLLKEKVIYEEHYMATRYIPNQSSSLLSDGNIVIHTDTAKHILQKHNVPMLLDRQQVFSFE